MSWICKMCGHLGVSRVSINEYVNGEHPRRVHKILGGTYVNICIEHCTVINQGDLQVQGTVFLTSSQSGR